MRDVIVHCYKIMNKTLSPEFRKQYAKGLRSFVDAYPDMDTCAVISRDISRLNGEEIDIEEAMDMVQKFDSLCRERRLRLVMDRSWLFPLSSVPMLSLDNNDHWASASQIASGSVLKDILSSNGIYVPEFIAICLNPTGGIAGPGNVKLFSSRPGTVMSVHAAIHDSYGYAKLYHDIGFGYNYTQSWFDIFPTTSPRAGQVSGLWNCYKYKS